MHNNNNDAGLMETAEESAAPTSQTEEESADGIFLFPGKGHKLWPRWILSSRASKCLGRKTPDSSENGSSPPGTRRRGRRSSPRKTTRPCQGFRARLRG